MATKSDRGVFNLRLAVLFLAVALVAAFCGFSGVAGGVEEAAKLVFFIFLVAAAVQVVVEMSRHPPH